MDCNSAIAQINFKEAFDSINHHYILEVFDLPNNLINILSFVTQQVGYVKKIVHWEGIFQ